MYISMKNISKSVNDVSILKDISFNVEKNQLHGIVGINGSGKSTLMNILMGLVSLDSGNIEINGKELKHNHNFSEERMMMVHQNIEILVEDLTVAENLYLGRWPVKRFGKIDWRKLILDSKQRLKELDFDIDVNKTVSELDYCEKRMLEVAMALSMEVKILILDEVNIGIEQYDQMKFLKLLKKINESGVTIIYISNRLKNVISSCDAISIMSKGEVVKTVKKFEYDNSRIIEDMLEKEFKSNYPKISTIKNRPLLSLLDVNTNNLKKINLTLFQGEVLGVTGLVKSGCLDIAETIFGVQPLESGTIKIFNEEADINGPHDAIKYSIGYVPNEQQKGDINPYFDIAENILLPNIENKFSRKSLRQDYCAQKYIQSFHIEGKNGKDILPNSDLQNYKKVAFARWHHLNSNILIYDEPTRPLDIPSKIDFYNYLNYLTDKQKGVLLISTDIEELIGVCDRILVIYNGEISKSYIKDDFDKKIILKSVLGVD